MDWIDLAILAAIGVSTLISLVRGFVREILSLVVWVLAFLVALTFAGALSAHLAFVSDSGTMRSIAAFVALFVATLIAGAIVNHMIGAVISGAGLRWVDRAAGTLFGLVRGVALVAALMVVGLIAGLDARPWWQESSMIGLLQPVAAWMHGWLPPDIGATA